ncbi:hypothetical protein [Amycolatopsis sp. DSM 110486]|uniref:hypothetical protein n=1 Tax=Amycolatopsis sp. DSM 110486 TaxID=2865832 RepID=UPI001C6A7042|nr:hypothetical protein [Amycolatopsis sp. DSM 110486]QYN17568.1 hypothetical protein K1T34_32805 [Amycolatopsis sp. DSM 110486]
MGIAKKVAAVAALGAAAVVVTAGTASAAEVGQSGSYTQSVVKETSSYTKTVEQETATYTKVLVREGKCYLVQPAGGLLYVGDFQDGHIVHPGGKGTLLDLNLGLDLRVLQQPNGDSLIKVATH